MKRMLWGVLICLSLTAMEKIRPPRKKVTAKPYSTTFASSFDDELSKAFEQFPEYKAYLQKERENWPPLNRLTQDYIISPDFIFTCINKLREIRKKYLIEKSFDMFYERNEIKFSIIKQEIVFLNALLKHERLKRTFQNLDEQTRKMHLQKAAQKAMQKGMFSLIKPIIRLGINSMSPAEIDFFIQQTITINKMAIELDKVHKYLKEVYKNEAEEERVKEQVCKVKKRLEPIYSGSLEAIRDLLTSVPLTPSSCPEYLSNGSCTNTADRERFNQDVATMTDVADSAIPNALQFYLIDLRMNPQLLVPQPDKPNQKPQDYLPYQILRYYAMDANDRRWPNIAGCIRLLAAHKSYFEAWDQVDAERNKDRARLAGSLITCDTVKTFAAALPDERWQDLKNIFWGSWWREFKEADTAQVPQPPKQSPADKLVSG